jgi:hypothetical protein
MMPEFFGTFPPRHPLEGFFVAIRARDRATAIDLMDRHYGRGEWDLLLNTRQEAIKRDLDEVSFG